ncbi:MAG: hypothetical protein FWH43_03125 [Endomicrobia bacterium]|nr:hypothetical protein [Endomicrobiia bacterium]
MPLYKTPEVNDNKVYVENQKKVQEIKALREKSSGNKNKSIYKQLKKIKWTIKDVFRNFHKVIRIFLQKKDNITYIACIFQGGLGDMLRSKIILEELIKMSPNAVVDIYNKKSTFILNGIDNIRFFLNIDAINVTKKRYDIVYNMIPVDILFIKHGNRFTDTIKNNLKDYREQYPSCFDGSKIKDLRLNPLNIIKMLAGVNDIYNDKISLKYKEQPLEKFGITKETKYITFNCGAGGNGTLGNAKCWSANHWEKLLSILKLKIDKNIKIVNVGVSSHYFKDADINIAAKTSLDELCNVLKSSLLHIDIEGACVHIANALGTKSVVLFGISDYDTIGYKENINIVSSLCGGCWEQGTKCPLGYDKPLCMESITPEFVAEKVIEYLKNYEKV